MALKTFLGELKELKQAYDAAQVEMDKMDEPDFDEDKADQLNDEAVKKAKAVQPQVKHFFQNVVGQYHDRLEVPMTRNINNLDKLIEQVEILNKLGR